MKKNIIIFLAILVVGIVVGLLCRPKGCISTTIVQRDTTIVHDTIIIEKPILVEKVRKETVLVHVHDTTIVNDSVFVAMPVEKKTYKGEDYLAEISGYRASLDRIEIYAKTQYVTETRREIIRHKNYISAGVEAGWCGKPYTPIYLEYSRMLHKNIVFNAGVFRDLVREENGMRVGIKAQIGW